MAKIQNLGKWGRSTARERYARGGDSGKDPNPALSDINIDEEGTDAYYAKQEEKMGVPESQRHYGDPDPIRPRRGRPLLKGQ